MFLLFRYKKNGLPSGLIKIHEFLLEDIILYFERSKFIRKRVKEARKAIKQSLKFAKKKKISPSIKINRAVELMEELFEEVEYTHQVLKEAAIEMESLINQIKEERVMNISSLINTAHEHFREKELEKGMELLKEAQNELGENFLLESRKNFLAGVESRKNFLAGVDSEIKKIKYEIKEKQKK
jgi:hypothetical protein